MNPQLPFSTPQAEVDALILFAAEHPRFGQLALEVAAIFQTRIFLNGSPRGIAAIIPQGEPRGIDNMGTENEPETSNVQTALDGPSKIIPQGEHE